jgi:hypothetical protein
VWLFSTLRGKTAQKIGKYYAAVAGFVVQAGGLSLPT